MKYMYIAIFYAAVWGTNLHMAVAYQSDQTCGPRCVSVILNHFNIEHDILDLIVEIQGDRLNEGTTLKQLETALQSHGLQTSAVQLSSQADIAWSDPVLTHIGPIGEGHWVVWLPPGPEDDGPLLHDGVKYIRVPIVAFSHLRTGPALLTSLKPIDNIERSVVAGVRTPTPLSWGMIAFVVVALTVSLVGIPALFLWFPKGAN